VFRRTERFFTPTPIPARRNTSRIRWPPSRNGARSIRIERPGFAPAVASIFSKTAVWPNSARLPAGETGGRGCFGRLFALLHYRFGRKGTRLRLPKNLSEMSILPQFEFLLMSLNRRSKIVWAGQYIGKFDKLRAFLFVFVQSFLEELHQAFLVRSVQLRCL
jgi:hypothetical protein